MIFCAPHLTLLFSRHFYTADGLHHVKHCETYAHHAFDKIRNRRRRDFCSAAEYALSKLDIVWHRLGRFVVA